MNIFLCSLRVSYLEASPDRNGLEATFFVCKQTLNYIKKQQMAGRWWQTPLILALGRQRQGDLFEFETSLEVYKS